MLVILAIVKLILAAIVEFALGPNTTIVDIALIARVVEDHVFRVLRVIVKVLQVFTFDEAPPELWYKICGKKQRGAGAMLEPNERHKRCEEKRNEFLAYAAELTSWAETTPPREATAASRAVARKWIFMMVVELMCTKLDWWIYERYV